MKIKIPRKNWHMALADAIERAAPGDTILCHEEAMAELGRSALSRMCPEKLIYFEIGEAEEQDGKSPNDKAEPRGPR